MEQVYKAEEKAGSLVQAVGQSKKKYKDLQLNCKGSFWKLVLQVICRQYNTQKALRTHLNGEAHEISEGMNCKFNSVL